MTALTPQIQFSSWQLLCELIDKGHIHPFCGNNCARLSKMRSGGTGANLGSAQYCHLRPNYQYRGRMFDYDGKTCVHITSNAQRSTQAAQGINGQLAQAFCLLCSVSPDPLLSHYCGVHPADNLGPFFVDVPPDHVTFKNVADQFYAGWRHPQATTPTIKQIYQVQGSKLSFDAYRGYQESVELRGNFRNFGGHQGNEHSLFHGTTRECRVGEGREQKGFCFSPSCSLCSILMYSFDLGFFGKRTRWGRFGKGIYTTSTSSKANNYSRNPRESQLKALILAKVIVGRGFRTMRDSPNLTRPPQGYDSVLGEAGGSLKWDEVVVYNNDAIRPSYLIMYQL